MAIIKDVTVKINNGTATLDAPVQFYEKDHDVELRFRLMDYKYKYDKDPQNILNSVDEDVLEAYTTIVNPRGYELEQINGVIKNDTVIFRLDPTYTDELDELGTYKLQIHIKCTHSEFTIPPITFEVLQRLKGIKVVTDGEDEVDNSEILDNSSKFVSDETGKLIIEWKKGDMISSAKLNAMVDVINDAVDEEVIRQANERERERKANNKIQELENTRVEYINKFNTELDSFADQVDTSMSDYETRFNALTTSQQQDAEVIDARDGEQTLRARLDRDIQKPSIIYEEVEGSHINVDTTSGYAQNIEILGNTIQNQNDLADIRSVGDKVENQDLYEIPVLSVGKNLIDETKLYIKDAYNIKLKANTTYYFAYNRSTTTTGVYFMIKDTKGDKYVGGFTEAWATERTHSDYNYECYYTSKNITPLQDCIITYITKNDKDMTNVILAESTQATEYEPYQERQITILSPTPLEKVGDIADRIICKDGVWGIEKNIKTVTFDGSESYRIEGVSNFLVGVTLSDISNISSFICYPIDKVNLKTNADNNPIGITITHEKYVRIKPFEKNVTTLDEGIEWIKTNKPTIKYLTTQPQFIPLPYDQQVKLRTFANKTNISFECEIEPTLKASVPKSLGATVNSHSEQIDNLGKELDKVKKLEESTASTVTTESDFTTVEATSNGYFEDVKIEGRTLVNLFSYCKIENTINSGIIYSSSRKVNGDFTLIFTAKTEHTDRRIQIGLTDIEYNGTVNNLNEYIKFIEITSEYKTYIIHCSNAYEGYPSIRIVSSKAYFKDIIILEGDHTQNPPEYFEGIKSVGQDVDEITITTTNAPMFFGKGGKK